MSCTNASDISMLCSLLLDAPIPPTTRHLLKHALRIDAVQWTTFQSTIRRTIPVVQEMVNRMCEEAKTDETINQDEFESCCHIS